MAPSISCTSASVCGVNRATRLYPLSRVSVSFFRPVPNLRVLPRRRRSGEADRTLQDALRLAVLLPERFGLPRQPFHLRRPSRGLPHPRTTLSRGPHRASSDYSIRGVAPGVSALLYVYASRPTLTESRSAKWSLMY